MVCAPSRGGCSRTGSRAPSIVIGNSVVFTVGPAEGAMPFFRSEMAKYAAIVKKAGVEAQ